MTDPTRTRHEWDCGDARVVRTRDEHGQTAVWIEDSRTASSRIPVTESLLEAAATALRLDTPRWGDAPSIELTEAESTTYYDAIASDPLTASPYARPTEPTWKDSQS